MPDDAEILRKRVLDAVTEIVRITDKLDSAGLRPHDAQLAKTRLEGAAIVLREAVGYMGVSGNRKRA